MWKKVEVLSSLQKEGEDLFFETVSGATGIILKCAPIDCELIDDEKFLKSFNSIFQTIPPAVRLRIHSRSQFDNQDIVGLSRTTAMAQLTFRVDSTFLIIETEKNWNPFSQRSHQKQIEQLQQIARKFKDLTVEVGQNGENRFKPFSPPTKAEIEALFLPVHSEITIYPDYLVINQELIGLVRIKANTHQALNLETLCHLRAQTDFNHEVISLFLPLSMNSQEFLLNNLQTEAQLASKTSELNRREEVERLDDAVSQFEEQIFEVELMVKVKADNEAQLRERLRFVAELLQKGFNSHYIESFGVYPSFCATVPGSRPHVTFKELGSGLLFYAPLLAHQSRLQQEHSKITLRMHRRGGALQSVSLISDLYQSGNTMIIGPKGSGKSVLAGLLTQALYNDPSVKILKMDVGSSYVRECAKLGGVRFGLDLNEPSGLNPLEVLAKTPHDLEIADIVADFIEVLIAKTSTMGLEDEERASLDRLVIAYSESRPKAPSLDDFLVFGKGQIPNQILLERWTQGGMYANIFKPIPGLITPRYRYFDFKSVNNATNPSLVRGSIAAVMAQYNSEVAISGRNGPRIFLFCDETTEFLNLCSPFFITTAKNSRKFGHATILINQESSSFQVRDRKGDLTNSLFENTDHHFLFATPSDPEDAEKFKARHRLDGAEFQRAKTLSYQKGKYSEVFYKTRVGGQVLRITMSREEYWLLTSDKNDYDKLDRLKEVGFSEEEAMQCLGQLHSQLY